VLLLEGVSEKLAKLGVHGFGKIVAKESEGGVDFVLEHFGAAFGEGGEYLNEKRKKVGTFGDGAGSPREAACQELEVVPRAVDERELVPHFPKAPLEFAQQTLENGRHDKDEMGRGRMAGGLP